ncbi:MAG: nucleoside deaminase [Magnetococcales bacterium]|nr:nucleoside deaminase [Magnetococcales bacterium]
MACEEALKSVQNGGGPFGAVLIQVDRVKGRVVRYWRNHNHVTQWHDPTAHAEISVIRAACQELGVFNLGKIHRKRALLPQKSRHTHTILYSSTEPCPMCYGAIAWARIPALIFAATRFEAGQSEVGFSDADIYQELAQPYKKRQKMRTIRQALSQNAQAPFELWKRSDKEHY